MPTKEELQAEAAATGVPYNTLLARDYKAKTYGTPASELQLGEGVETSEAPVEPISQIPIEQPQDPMGQSFMAGTEGTRPLESTQDMDHYEKLRKEAIGSWKVTFGNRPIDEKKIKEQISKWLLNDPYPSQIPQVQTEQEQAPGQRKPSLYSAPQAPGAVGGVGGGGIGMPSARGMIGAAETITEKRKDQIDQVKREKEDELTALQGLAQVEAATESERAGIMINRQTEMERVQGENMIREQKRQTAVTNELNKVRDAVETMKASKIDPYRFYKHPDGSTDFPKSIAAVIAVGLGALGSSLPRSMGGTGGPNMALSILDKSIDRDIKAQVDDIANQRAGVGIQMNLLGQMRGQFADERSAEAAARVVMFETFQMKLEQAATKSGSKKIMANAAALTAGVEARKNAEIRKIEDTVYAGELQTEQLKYKTRAESAKARMSMQAAAAKAQGAMAPEMGGYVATRPVSESEKKEARKVVDTYSDGVASLDLLLTLGKDIGKKVLSGALSTESQLVRQAYTDALLVMKDVKNLGVLAGPDMELLEDLIANPSDLFKAGALESLEQAKNSIQGQFNRRMKIRGFGKKAAPTREAEAI